MSEDQLFLLATIFATRRDSVHLSQVLPYFNEQNDIYNAICVLWPELDVPTHLDFLFHPKEAAQVNNAQDLLVGLLETDNKLIPIVEMENSIVSERGRAIKNYVDVRLAEVPKCKRFMLDTFEARWMRNRMLLCNRLKPQQASFYSPLWSIANKDSKFKSWISGIVEPLDHINKRLGRFIKIEEFEQMKPSEVFSLILHAEPTFHTTVINREIIPYLENSELYETFMDSVFTKSTFPLDSVSNLTIFKELSSQLLTAPSFAEHNAQIQSRMACIVFESSNLLEVCTLSELYDLLSNMNQNVQVENYSLTVESLKQYTAFMKTVLRKSTLKDVYSITQEEEPAQIALLASIVREQMLHYDNGRETLEQIFQVIDAPDPTNANIFNRLSTDQKSSVLIETALEMGKFDLLEDFIATYNSTVDEDVLVKYFWHFFNKASNGLKTRPEMRNAQKTLELLLKRNKVKFNHLQSLLDVANELASYSLNLGKGVPFKPSDILDFASKPLDLISLLLELNPDLYQDIESTQSILKKLSIGLDLTSSSVENIDECNVKILVLHIDHSLARMDFGFALRKTKELLKKDGISQYWPTIFQVGKFIDPRWPDGEAPIDIIALQIEVLADLLEICPVEEVEAVASQWSALELELMASDPTKTQFSEEHRKDSNKISQGSLLFNGVSSTFTSFLSGS